MYLLLLLQFDTHKMNACHETMMHDDVYGTKVAEIIIIAKKNEKITFTEFKNVRTYGDFTHGHRDTWVSRNFVKLYHCT